MRHVSLHSRNYGRRRFIWRGPLTLFASWLLHDLEEAIAFPSTCDYLAERSRIQSLRINAKQSRLVIGSMGLLVGFACWRRGGKARRRFLVIPRRRRRAGSPRRRG